MFRQFHDKHVLINGQGPVKEIAQNLGFTKVTSVEELSACFPYLDVMDHKRRRAAVSCWIFLLDLFFFLLLKAVNWFARINDGDVVPIYVCVHVNMFTFFSACHKWHLKSQALVFTILRTQVCRYSQAQSHWQSIWFYDRKYSFLEIFVVEVCSHCIHMHLMLSVLS